MPELQTSLTRIFPYKEGIINSVLKRVKKAQSKPIFWHILSNVCGRNNYVTKLITAIVHPQALNLSVWMLNVKTRPSPVKT